MTPTGNQPLTFAQFCLATGWTVNRAREFMTKYRDRPFALGDAGEEYTLVRSEKPKEEGYQWSLVPLKSKEVEGESNVVDLAQERRDKAA